MTLSEKTRLIEATRTTPHIARRIDGGYRSSSSSVTAGGSVDSPLVPPDFWR